MSFTRRFSSYPSQQQISAIEGVVIVDQTPLGGVQGVGTGVVAMIGEFQDCSYAGVWDKSTGEFSAQSQPVQIFSAADLLLKAGGFDPTIGDIGNSGGNGFVDLYGKTFSSLVLSPVNIASQYGVRVVRQLPTNAGPTNPTPAIPMAPGSVPAGTEFKSGADRLRTAQRVNFTAQPAYGSGVDGEVTLNGAGSAGSQTFQTAAGDLNALGAEKGDILVLGVIGASGAQGSNAGTYRLAANPTDATHVAVEKMDGSDFNWVTGSSLAWRLHVGSTADSFGTGAAIADASQVSYLVAARPLDEEIDSGISMNPTVSQPAGTATSWAPLSGLTAVSGPNGVDYTAATQAPNPAQSATMDTAYQKAISALAQNASPAKQVNVVVSSRTSSTIRNALTAHVDLVSETGTGRTAATSPALNSEGETSTQSTSNILSNTSPGVGSNRDERIDYCWPGRMISIPDAVGFSVPTADGGTTTDGLLDIKSDAWLASIMSQLPSNQDPAQETQAVSNITAPDIGPQRGAPVLSMNDYIALKAAGVAAPVEGDDGRLYFESGVTTDLTSGQTDINRRRFADEVEDSLAAALKPFTKQDLTDALKDSEVAEVISYLEGLLSTSNPPAQRIAAYSVDDSSGNTAELLGAGIFTIIVAVQMLAEQKNIVLVCSVGPTVQVTQQQ